MITLRPIPPDPDLIQESYKARIEAEYNELTQRLREITYEEIERMWPYEPKTITMIKQVLKGDTLTCVKDYTDFSQSQLKSFTAGIQYTATADETLVDNQGREHLFRVTEAGCDKVNKLFIPDTHADLSEHLRSIPADEWFTFHEVMLKYYKQYVKQL